MAKKSTIGKNAFEDTLFGWNAPEFIRYERGWRWYLIMSVLDIGLIVYAYFTGSWSMALVFLLLPLVYILESRKKPKLTQVSLSSWGIKFGIIELPYTEIKQFWIHHNPPHLDELHLRTNNKLHPHLAIPLMGASPVLIRQYLLTQVPEWEGKTISFIDWLTRFLRLH